MLITVVIVCYNCKKEIEKTFQHIMCQEFKEVEYLVVDGASSDGTLEVAQSYTAKIPNLRIYSEPDSGIYDAMNKGILYASGEYVFFLNVGDFFFADNVLKLVAAKLESGKDLYYGNVIRGGVVEKYPQVLNKYRLIYLERMICHQAMFVKRSVYQKLKFDLQYKICSDRDFLIRALKENIACEYMEDITISIYDINGLSSQYEKFSKESLRIAEVYGGVKAKNFVKFKQLLRYIIKK